MGAPDKCPVCLNIHSDNAKIKSGGWGFRVNCSICGRFDVVRETWDDFLDPESPVAGKISELGRARLAHVIKTATASGPSGLPRLTSDDVERFIKAGCPGPSPGEQAVKAVRILGDSISQMGDRLSDLPPDFYAAIGASNPNMAGDLAIELLEKGIIDGISVKSANMPSQLRNINLTLDGWHQYESEKRGEVAGNYGFIAMKFDDDVLDPFVEGVVKPAVRDGIGYELLHMRDVAQAGIIDNIMRAQIRNSAFVIVDLTHDNSGAYWEAGYAEGLGKPVIYICEKDKFDSVKTHFDTNHCTTVVWSENEPKEFSQELIATLRRSLNLF